MQHVYFLAIKIRTILEVERSKKVIRIQITVIRGQEKKGCHL